MSYYSQNLNLFQIIFEKMKGLLLICMAKAESISNVATQKSCEQTVMDDDMKYCADRNYSLRTGFSYLFMMLDLKFLEYEKTFSVHVSHGFKTSWSHAVDQHRTDRIPVSA